METEIQTTPTNKSQGSSYVVPVAIIIAGALIAGAVYFSNGTARPKTNTANDTDIEDDLGTPGPIDISVDINGWPVLGDQNAPITLVEYADFACSFCGKFHTETLPSIKKDYIDTGKVKLVYKDFPVVGGDMAAEAAHCAGEQGKYWEYFDLLFDKQSTDRGTWNTVEAHKKYAEELGLNANALASCFNERKYQTKVQAATAEALKNGGQGTPFFIVGETPISGAQPYSVFQATFDAELAK